MIMVGLVWSLSGCTKEEINSFVECEEAGFEVMESYPRQCRDDKGNLFIEEV